MSNEDGVLPTREPERDESGQYRLTSKSGWIVQPIFLGLLGLFFLVMPTYFILKFFFEMILDKGFFAYSTVFFSFFSHSRGLFMSVLIIAWYLLGSALVYNSFQQIRLSYEVEPGHFLLSSWPLKHGQTVNVTFDRDLSADLNITKVTPRLTCEASLKVPSGDNKSTTKTKTVTEVDLGSFSPGDSHQGTLSREISFTVPKDAPSSLERPDHKYEWFLKVDFEFESVKNDTSSIKLLVLPEVEMSGNQTE